ncbi:phosphoribosylformylglycinamidine cyclo-ligase [Lacticaseibacillus zhaodongensis]|uniref:phosphoribosylformylglycinamidine cyclo-ligase n=1 Tax=Lacticaseibacillus zhaodongensis TaxID=2668065 RepID=UPI001E57E2BF|nr:phosphoribosylformylglycinamidine cyclo-ligase [Lacticaseibacillus zhaodongensis]
MKIDYKSAGVNVDAGNQAAAEYAKLTAATSNANVLSDLGGFAAAYRMPAVANAVLLAATDGVGTKLLLAKELGKHDTIGIDLVAMVANDLLADGAQPLFFLDYLACDQLDVAQAQAVVGGIAAGCKQAGMALIGGETAEMPDMYPQGHYDLAGFAVGVANADKTLPRGVAAGDMLIGLPSSGPHSNGFSLLRKLLAATTLGDQPLSDGRDVRAAMLTPTRIYVAELAPLISAGLIHGAAHITGGGFTDNVPRMLPTKLTANIQAGSWQWPELFRRVQQAGELSTADMRRTFNLGVGMVLAVAPANVAAVRQAIPDAIEIGTVTARPAGGPAVIWEEE